MRCPPPLVLFHYARGTIDPLKRRPIEAHVAVCRTCAGHVEKARQDAAARRVSPPSTSAVPRIRPGADATRNLGPLPLPEFDDDSATAIHSVPATPPPQAELGTIPSPPGHTPPVSEEAVTAPPPSRRRRTPGTTRPEPGAPSLAEPTRETVPKHRIPGGDDSQAMTLGAQPLFEEPRTPISAAFETSPATGRVELPRGTALGRYLVVEPLGSGGLGDVYTAYDPELDRCVAIKVLRPSLESTDDWDVGTGSGSGGDRLVREAKALARLSHPNVVAIYDVGRLGDDVFIAMERVEGMTLSQWRRAAEHSWPEIRDVFLGAGEGLAAAHDAGIVHRDFKPANVIVGPDGRPRVLDFGLARAVRREEGSGLIALPRIDELRASHSGDSLDGPVTLEGTVMGTPQYMAPEQFEGADRTGPGADQFGFCVALWNTLYGEPPFQGEGIPGLIHAVRAGDITEPSERRGTPAWLHKVMLRGLSTEPADRFASMHDLLHAMQRDRRSRRRQWVGLGVVALVSALGAGAAALLLRPPVTDEHRSRVDQLADQARDAAARSYYVYPAPDDADAVTAYRTVLELEALEGPAETLADERAAELREEMASTLTRLGDRYYEREGGRAFAADYYAAALVFDPDDDHARSRTSLTRGEVAELRDRATQGDFTPAELTAAASLAVLAVENEDERREKLVALYSGDQAPSPSTAARMEALLDEDEVEAIAEAVKPRRRRTMRPSPRPEPEPTAPPEPEPEPDAETGSEDGEEEAAAEAEAPPPTRDPAKARTLAKQGAAAFKRGEFGDAESLFHRALSHDRRNAAALGGLAELYFERGSYQKATQYASKAVGAAPKSGKYRIVLGDAHFKSLSYGSARREYEKAKALGHPSAAGRLALLDKRLGK